MAPQRPQRDPSKPDEDEDSGFLGFLKSIPIIGPIISFFADLLGGLFTMIAGLLGGGKHDAAAPPAASADTPAPPLPAMVPVIPAQAATVAAPAVATPPVPAAVTAAKPTVAVPAVATAKPTTLKMEEMIDGTLSAMSKVSDAQEMANVPGIGYKSANGQYASAGHGNMAAITDESIKQVSVTLGDTTRFFHQIGTSDGKQGNGMVGTAWVETDANGKTLKDAEGKFQVRMTFQGYTGDPEVDSAQTRALKAVAAGQLNPQAVDTAIFTHNVLNGDAIKAEGGAGKVSGVIFGAHSLGSSNAMVAQAVTDIAHVPATTSLQIEPVAARQQLQLLQAALADPGSALSKTLTPLYGDAVAREATHLTSDVSHNTISIRMADNNQGTAVAYLTVGKGLEQAKQDAMIAQLLNKNPSIYLSDARGGNNAPVGTALYQDVTGDNPNVSTKKTPLSELAKYHDLPSILAGVEGGNEIKTAQLQGSNLSVALLPVAATVKDVLGKS